MSSRPSTSNARWVSPMSLAVAVLAAHRGTIVPPGGSAEFCAPLPITELARDPAISPPERAALTDLLIRLGITTAGAFAALPEGKVATRFGADGVQAHRLARGLAERGVSRRQIPEELKVEQVCDPPLDRVDTAAFAARALAERFHARLADAGLACTRLAITAVTERDATLSRIWRCAAPLTAAATADRLRWQLDGWLTAGRTAGRGRRPRSDHPAGAGTHRGDRCRAHPVRPVGVRRAGRSTGRLGVRPGAGPARARIGARAGALGWPESRWTGSPWCRGVTRRSAPRNPADPWPGSIPAPSPSRVDPGTGARPRRSTVLDEAGQPVLLTGRGLLTGSPGLVGAGQRTATAHRRLGRTLAVGRTMVGSGSTPDRCQGAGRHRERGRPAGAVGDSVEQLADRGGVRLMGWNNPNVPWSELERALSGRPPLPGRAHSVR